MWEPYYLWQGFVFSVWKALFFLPGLAYVKGIMIILMILNSSFDLLPPQANRNII